MKKLLMLGVALFILISCRHEIKTADKVAKSQSASPVIGTSMIGQPIVPAVEATKDFNAFWEYYSRNIELYEDFVAFDSSGKTIGKENFLKQIKSGVYFPLALHSKDERLNYKLSKIPSNADQNISAYMRQFASEQLLFYKLEGKPAPAFNFTDVNGKVYSSVNTKGKIVLFKCWFISCKPCVKEMPALNKIVDKYKDRNDILFISLAIDKKKELQDFLAKTKFDYATIPMQEEYMKNKLHVAAYPTHFLINKQGNIVRMLPDEIQVAEAIEKELAK